LKTGPTKKTEKFSEFWQNFKASQNSTDFSKCVPFKNSEQKFAEILPASSTKKKLVKKSLISRKHLWILNFLNWLEKIFHDKTYPGCPNNRII
jgi:hypothetical protein